MISLGNYRGHATAVGNLARVGIYRGLHAVGEVDIIGIPPPSFVCPNFSPKSPTTVFRRGRAPSYHRPPPRRVLARRRLSLAVATFPAPLPNRATVLPLRPAAPSLTATSLLFSLLQLLLPEFALAAAGISPCCRYGRYS